MAINPNLKYPGRVTAPDADYTYGSSKNESSPGAGDGTPYELARANDIFGLQQALLRSAGIVPNNNADTQLASEYLQSIIELASGRAFIYDDSGIADAYVLDVRANQQPPANLFEGLQLLFTPSATNTGVSTVNPFGTGIENIKLPGGVAGPAAGDIFVGRPARLVYRVAPSVHFELDVTEISEIGQVDGFAQNTAPSGWLKANGAAISRTTYAVLFAKIGTIFGIGDGSTTFNTPDLRAEVIRGWDDGRGIDSGRSFGSAQSDAMQGHYHGIFGKAAPAGSEFIFAAGYSGAPTGGDITVKNATAKNPVTDGINGTPRTAAETRARNIALLYCIKY